MLYLAFWSVKNVKRLEMNKEKEEEKEEEGNRGVFYNTKFNGFLSARLFAYFERKCLINPICIALKYFISQ
jgi:hypothetical protein